MGWMCSLCDSYRSTLDRNVRLNKPLHSFFTESITVSHCFQNPKPQKMLLSGYGVELAIKSTEYKAVDDTKVKGQFVTYQTFCAGFVLNSRQ